MLGNVPGFGGEGHTWASSTVDRDCSGEVTDCTCKVGPCHVLEAVLAQGVPGQITIP